MNTLRSTTIGQLAAPTKSALATGPFGSAVSSKNFRTAGVPMLRGSNLKEDVGTKLHDEELVFLEPELAAKFSRSIAKRGDLVFTNWGSVGQVGLIDENARFDSYIVSNKQMKMTPDLNQVIPLYLYYYLSHPSMIREVKSRAIGSTIPGFNLGQLRELPVVIPPLEAQANIAEVLSALDDKIAANTRLSRTADQLAGHLFDQAASSVPSVSMSEVLTPVLGGTPARANAEFWNGEDFWASAKDITGAPFAVIMDTEEQITQQAVDRTKAKPLPVGSVILTARGTVGAVARLAVPSSFNQSCYGFIPNELPPGLLYFSILRAAQDARSLAHGSVFDTITMRTFDHLMIPDFGHSGVSTEAQIAPLLDLVTANVMENASLAATRDALLPQLMSGQLRVKDAEAFVESAV